MVALAQMYDQGDGCVKDHELALSWYKKAAGMGNILARERLVSLGEL
jgi:TPR repeat protein